MYDLIVDAIHTLLRNGLTFSSLIAVLFLLLKNRKLKRYIQHHLPRMLRSNEEDMLHEIRRDVKSIKSHFGIEEEEGWNHANTCSPIRKPSGQTAAAGSMWFLAVSCYVQSASKFMILIMRRLKSIMQKFLTKMASRKFWALIAALVTANLVLFGVSEEVIVKVAAVVTQAGAVVVYILAEASVDRESQRQNVYVVDRKEAAADESAESGLADEPRV